MKSKYSNIKPPTSYANLGPHPTLKWSVNLTSPIRTKVSSPINIQSNFSPSFDSSDNSSPSSDSFSPSSPSSSPSSSPTSNYRRYRVGGIVLDADNHLLIVYGRQSKKWSLPKGGLNQGEEYLQGALREIWEETGFRMIPNQNDQITCWTINKARIYILRINQKKPRPKPIDQNEVEKACWLNLKDVQQMAIIRESANKMLINALDRLQRMNAKN